MNISTFWKYHGLGNDFVLVDWRGKANPSPSAVVQLCDRHEGVGADGILALVEDPAGRPMMRVFNSDGSIADMCGNGLRCFVRWMIEEMGFSAQDEMIIGSDAGDQICSPVLNSEGLVTAVTVNLGNPRDIDELTLVASNLEYQGHRLFLGNPHYVIARSPNPGELHDLGPALSTHDAFENDTNVEWLEVLSRREANVVVYERGAGLTRACGTGGAAAAAMAVQLGLMDGDVSLTIHQPGGVLYYRVADDGVWMTGPAQPVFRGQLLS